MKKCTYCGCEVEDNVHSCPNCGLNIYDDEQKSDLPAKPTIHISDILFFLFLIGIAVICAFFFPNFFAIAVFSIDVLIIIALIKSDIKLYERYKLSIENLEEYRRITNQEQAERTQTRKDLEERISARKDEKEKEEKEKMDKLPCCPICCSKTNVRKIGNIERSVSVTAFGLASSKIGKQYECTHCKHKF